MALDIAIVDEQDRPLDIVALDVDMHERLIVAAQKRGLSHILRIYDYYEEAIFQTTELPKLIHELETLLISVDIEPSVLRAIGDLRSISQRALQQGRRLISIPD